MRFLDFFLFVTCVVSNMDSSGGTRIPNLAYICDYDDCGKLFVVRVEDFYLRKECPNCYNMFLKSEYRHKLVTNAKILSLFTSDRHVAVESKCLCRKINYSKKLDYFLLYVLFAHTALLLKMLQERTDYSPVDMEITSGASNTFRPETPRIGESGGSQCSAPKFDEFLL